MKVKTYRAADMRQAFELIKRDLGPQAVILTTRKVRDKRRAFGWPGRSMVEVTAAVDEASPEFKPPPSSPREEAPVKARPQGWETIRKEIDELRSQVVGLSLHRQRSSKGVPQHPLGKILACVTRVCDPLATSETRPVILALMGPTGVGKTTTIAKIAAHSALDDGRRVALITNDTYRIGAVEQLRTYARITGIPHEVVHRPEDLPAILDRFSRSQEIILMDTAGHSPWDDSQMAALKAYLDTDPRIKSLLVVSATTDPLTLKQVVERFSDLNPLGLIGTKLDEAASIESLLTASIESRLPFAYFTTGQRVPEDIRRASAEEMALWALQGIPAFCDAAQGRG